MKQSPLDITRLIANELMVMWMPTHDLYGIGPINISSCVGGGLMKSHLALRDYGNLRSGDIIFFKGLDNDRSPMFQ